MRTSHKFPGAAEATGSRKGNQVFTLRVICKEERLISKSHRKDLTWLQIDNPPYPCQAFAGSYAFLPTWSTLIYSLFSPFPLTYEDASLLNKEYAEYEARIISKAERELQQLSSPLDCSMSDSSVGMENFSILSF